MNLERNAALDMVEKLIPKENFYFFKQDVSSDRKKTELSEIIRLMNDILKTNPLEIMDLENFRPVVRTIEMVDETILLYNKRLKMMNRFINDYIHMNAQYGDDLDTNDIQDKMDFHVNKISNIIKTLDEVPRYAWTKLPMGHLHDIDCSIKTFVEQCKQMLEEYLEKLSLLEKRSVFTSKFKQELFKLEIEQRAVLAELNQELIEKKEAEEKSQQERKLSDSTGDDMMKS